MKRNGSRSPLTLTAALLPGLAVTLATFVRVRAGSPVPVWEAAPLLASLFILGASLLPAVRSPAGPLPVWSVPALGYLLVVGIPLLAGLLPEGTVGEIFTYLWFLLAASAAFLLLAQQQRQTPLPSSLWLLLGLALLAQPVLILFAGLLLLPAALTLRLAAAHGTRAALLIAPALYWPVDVFFEPAYGLALWGASSRPVLGALLALLSPLLFLIIVPAGLLLARSRKQLVAAILPVPLLLLAGEVARSGFFAATARGGYGASMWLTRGGTILQVTLLLVWTVAACHYVANWEKEGRQATAAIPYSTRSSAHS